MIERTLRDRSTRVWRRHDGLCIRVTQHVCESDMAGGQIVERVRTYEQLTDDEAVQVLEDLAHETLPGGTLSEHQMAFSL